MGRDKANKALNKLAKAATAAAKSVGTLGKALEASGIKPEDFLVPEIKLNPEKIAKRVAKMFDEELGKRTVPNETFVDDVHAVKTGFNEVWCSFHIDKSEQDDPSEVDKVYVTPIAMSLVRTLHEEANGGFLAFAPLRCPDNQVAARVKVGNVIVRCMIVWDAVARKIAVSISSLVLSSKPLVRPTDG